MTSSIKRRGLLVVVLALAACRAGGAPTPTTSEPDQTATVPATSSATTSLPIEISGFVVDEEGPVAGAVVRLQTTEIHAISGADGRFTLTLEDPDAGPLNLTGWAPGYFCSGPFEAIPGEQELHVELVPHAAEDNPDYAWLPSLYHPGGGEDQGCAECHSREGTTLPFPLPVDEWLLDAHARSASNPRFLTMYNGTDLDGNRSPLTQRGASRDYGTFPLPPDPSRPYYGPGYKLDFPDSDGNCAACHTPAAAVNEPYLTDPNYLSGVEAEGMPCDFCHKVWDVNLNPETGLPYENMPGVLSFEFLRPYEGHQFFAGPYDDVAPGEDTYSELQTQSAFCAPCHFGIFWGVTVYNSYGEWLASPYSDPDTGQTCQDCHMPPSGATQFATDEAGGLTRDPSTIFSHQMPGALEEELLQDALEMSVLAERDGEDLLVTVGLYNDNTGHKIPTDNPLRHMLLVVEVHDIQGKPVDLVEGPTLPDWAGEGETEQGRYAGLPGKAYALILEELWTEISPSGAYWNPTRVVADTRLDPYEEDFSRYRFRMPADGGAEVRVRLYLRRAYIEMMDQKGWTDPDMLMAEQVLKIGP